jgi:hypothetical protein
MLTPKQIEQLILRKKNKLRRYSSEVEATKKEISQLQKSLASAKKSNKK